MALVGRCLTRTQGIAQADSTAPLARGRMTNDDPRHPADRHGRLLRLGGAGPPPRACRPARDRRGLGCKPRCGEHRLLRGSRLRCAYGHAYRPGSASLPAGRLPAGRHEGLPAISKSCWRSSGASPIWSSRSRSTRPSSMSPARVASSVHRRRSPARSRSSSAASLASPARSASVPPSCLPSWPPSSTSPAVLRLSVEMM